MIGSTKFDGRRLLRFDTIDDVLADARVCVGERWLRQLGNWSIGQALNHVAVCIEYPSVGYPAELVEVLAGPLGQTTARGSFGVDSSSRGHL